MRKLLLLFVAFLFVLAGILLWAKQDLTDVAHVMRQHHDWSVSTDPMTDITAALPKTFGSSIWSTTIWPPRFAVIPADQNPLAQGCIELAESGQQPTIVYEDDEVRVVKVEEGGAGSLYSSYCAVKTERARSLIFYTVVRSHLGCGNNQCGAYCDTEFEAECRQFDQMTMIEEPLIDMAMSMRTSESLE